MRHSSSLLCAAAVLALAGCTTVAPGAQRDPASDTTRGITDTSIRVGGLLYKTSPFGASVANTEMGAKARFMRANDEGGVHGRRIDFIGAEDDGTDAAKNRAAARKLVQRDEVFAVVPVNTFAFNAGTFLKQQKVPFFGFGYLPDFCGRNEYGYGFNGCVVPLSEPKSYPPGYWHSLAEALGGANGRTIANVETDSAPARLSAKSFAKTAAAAGFEVVYNEATVPNLSPPTDWTPYVAKIMRSDNGSPPDIVYSNMTSAAVSTGLFTALKAAGYEGILMDGVSYRRNLLENAQSRQAYQGVLVGVPVQPVEHRSPAVEQMANDVAKAAGKKVPIDLDMEVGYATADVFLQVLEETGRDLTVEKFIETAKSASVESEISGPISFPQGWDVGFQCAAIVRVDGDEFKVVQPLTCTDPVSP